MAVTSRECDQCGTAYERKAGEVGRFCSLTCYSTNKRRDAESACAHCGLTFMHKVRKQRKYCSKPCAGAAIRKSVTRTCDRCGVEYTRTPAAVGRFCSPKCSKIDRRKEHVTARRMRYAPGHPLCLKAPYVPEHRAVLFDKIGPGSHPCHYCGESVTWVPGGRTGKGVLVVDHVDRNPMNNTPENLVPACSRCNVLNADRVVTDAESFRTVGARGTRLRGHARNCEYCGAGFVTWTMNPGEGKGRFCSRSCARRKPRAEGEQAGG